MEIRRVFDLLPFHQNQFPGQKDVLNRKTASGWQQYAMEDVRHWVDRLALALLNRGYEPGDKIAIVAKSMPEWNIIDFSIQQIGATSVPLYPNITAEDYQYIFQHCAVKAVFVGDAELWEKVQPGLESTHCVEQVFSIDPIEGLENWRDLCASADQSLRPRMEEIMESTGPEDLLTIIYTSGTTGNPKGVMLSHHNLVSNIADSLPAVPVDHRHRAVSFLPLCHVFERMIAYLYLRMGVSIYYAQDISTVGEDLKEVRPHLFTTAPRMLEKVYEKIMGKGYELPRPQKNLFFWALKLGQRYLPQKPGGPGYRLQLWLANKLVFKKWRAALGGNIICVVSGSAALQPQLARIFWSAQIPILEGYGLTETSPVIAVNRIRPEDNRIGTVGLLIENVEVRIAEDGEILCKGPNIMQGYYNDPDRTAEVIDADGWFHTGDLGEWYEGCFLKVTGRKKQVFKTSGGKYIAPEKVENKLKESLLIEQAMVVGPGYKYPGALVVPAFDSLREYCQYKGISCDDTAALVEDQAVLDKFGREIEEANKSLAQWEKVKNFRLLAQPFTIEAGELTPTMKLKRNVLYQRFAQVIDSMYETEQ